MPFLPPKQDRINVLHLVISLNTGGLERVVLDLIKHHSSLISPVLACLDIVGDHSNDLDSLCIPYYTLNNHGQHKMRTISRLLHIIWKHRINIIHTHNPSPHFYGSIAGLLARVPVVHTKHGKNFTSPTYSRITNTIASTLTKKIVCVSRDASLVATQIEGVPEHKVITITNGIDIGKYKSSNKADPDLQRDNFHFKQVVGIVARLSPEKDHVSLLHALPLILQRGIDAGLLVVGDGPAKEDILQLCRSLELSERVLLTGSRSDVPYLLSLMDVFVLPSLTEGMSLTLLEAMAAKLPIVCSNVGGNPEVVIDGENGFLVPVRRPDQLADRICQLLKDQTLASTMGLEGYRLVTEKFNVKTIVTQYESLYGQLTTK